MSTPGMGKTYNPQDFEDRIYSFWMENNIFQPVENNKDPFVIVIPPPNVTGILHMGHGLNNTLQDIIIRYYRMNGRPALWIPGTDHAGIATQNVVEKKLKNHGTSRKELGREEFVKETWKVKEEHQGTIRKQLQRMGCSCDWTRERFTLDEGCSKAVKEVFVTLYERELIYKGNYLVNWCPSCGTALSDDEVEHQEVNGKMYHYQYPFEKDSGFIEIATTRPETMLGDTAVAVHPEDERFKSFIGRNLILPLTNRVIPVIADKYVDMEFGTGAVKITPAHDPNDWEMGNRHSLEKINILNPDGTLNENVPGKYRGLSVIKAREQVIKDLKEAGLFIKETEHQHQVGHCYRCSTAIEPYLSEQWFVAMKTLADKALKAWEKDEIVFFPKKWENTYTHWLRNIRDWCISRQLWWGHRIPVWYCRECGNMMVLREDPECCSKCNSKNIHQDEDVLDTWFSSWLWPFSTLGWPEKTEDIGKYYPTTALITGYDIIFFWVARMIMAGLEFMDKVPFRDIYITGLVRDIKGRKMSKSLGNGMDPLEIIDEYGADALKFTLAFLAAQGQDILIEKDTFKTGSRFANKIWNASRYILMNFNERRLIPFKNIVKTDTDLWILHRLNETVKTVRKAVEKYRFNEAAQGMYEFFWNDFCDWYIEASKLSLYCDDDNEKDRAISLLIYVLEESLKLLHPFMSFITEEIFQKLPDHGMSIAASEYPCVRIERENHEVLKGFSSLQELVRGIRTIRSEFTIPPEKKIKVSVKTDTGFSSAQFFHKHKDLIISFVNSLDICISEVKPDTAGSIAAAGNGFEAYVFVKDVIDLPKQIEKLNKENTKLKKLIEQTDKKLSNDKFLCNAPQEIVEKEKNKLKEFVLQNEKITGYLKELG